MLVFTFTEGPQVADFSRTTFLRKRYFNENHLRLERQSAASVPTEYCPSSTSSTSSPLSVGVPRSGGYTGPELIDRERSFGRAPRWCVLREFAGLFGITH